MKKLFKLLALGTVAALLAAGMQMAAFAAVSGTTDTETTSNRTEAPGEVSANDNLSNAETNNAETNNAAGALNNPGTGMASAPAAAAALGALALSGALVLKKK